MQHVDVGRTTCQVRGRAPTTVRVTGDVAIRTASQATSPLAPHYNRIVFSSKLSAAYNIKQTITLYFTTNCEQGKKLKSPWNQIPRTKYAVSKIREQTSKTPHDNDSVATGEVPVAGTRCSASSPWSGLRLGLGLGGYRLALLWLQVCSRQRRLELPWLRASTTMVA
eukprot:scaffold77628_cov69-Phaeocystis_antarctica.AAC.1